MLPPQFLETKRRLQSVTTPLDVTECYKPLYQEVDPNTVMKVNKTVTNKLTTPAVKAAEKSKKQKSNKQKSRTEKDLEQEHRSSTKTGQRTWEWTQDWEPDTGLGTWKQT